MCKYDDMKLILNLIVDLCNNLMIYFFILRFRIIYMYSKFTVVKYDFHRTLKTRLSIHPTIYQQDSGH